MKLHRAKAPWLLGAKYLAAIIHPYSEEQGFLAANV